MNRCDENLNQQDGNFNNFTETRWNGSYSDQEMAGSQWHSNPLGKMCTKEYKIKDKEQEAKNMSIVIGTINTFNERHYAVLASDSRSTELRNTVNDHCKKLFSILNDSFILGETGCNKFRGKYFDKYVEDLMCIKGIEEGISIMSLSDLLIEEIQPQLQAGQVVNIHIIENTYVMNYYIIDIFNDNVNIKRTSKAKRGTYWSGDTKVIKTNHINITEQTSFENDVAELIRIINTTIVNANLIQDFPSVGGDIQILAIYDGKIIQYEPIKNILMNYILK